ncbi:unnamed protein product [Dicrocoelium dendriticum]|nr:unnamed protein product [Dicrocoelium dendriticum]
MKVERENISSALKTDDVFRSSYGVGHHWRSPYYFPDSNTLQTLSKNVVCSKIQENVVKPAEHYQTTTGTTHNYKIIPEELRVNGNSLAPHHWKLHYINEFRTRYLAKHPTRSLSPSNQKTETQDSYQACDGPAELWRPSSIKPFVLEQHHNKTQSQKDWLVIPVEYCIQKATRS